jgi:hypothetical protein
VYALARSPVQVSMKHLTSGTSSFEMKLLLLVALGMVSLNYQKIPQEKQGLGITTEVRGITKACSRLKILKSLSSLSETMCPTPISQKFIPEISWKVL